MFPWFLTTLYILFSKSCAEIDWETSHSLLCTGKRSESVSTEALLEFLNHANGKATFVGYTVGYRFLSCVFLSSLFNFSFSIIPPETNDIFLLAAKVRPTAQK